MQATAPRQELPPGTTVGSWEVLRTLGKGGMGIVYEAKHRFLGTQAALKTLLPEHAEDGQVVMRFMNEARAAAHIGHPGIVDVKDVFEDAGTFYIALEFLKGEELSERIDRGALPPALALEVTRQAASAMAAAHAAGIIHRDLKPDNLFLTTSDAGSLGTDATVASGAPDLPHVKVLDFGIAKVSEGVLKTKSRMILGTAPYMAPEQWQGAEYTVPATDVYALGLYSHMFCI